MSDVEAGENGITVSTDDDYMPGLASSSDSGEQGPGVATLPRRPGGVSATLCSDSDGAAGAPAILVEASSDEDGGPALRTTPPTRSTWDFRAAPHIAAARQQGCSAEAQRQASGAKP